jgi:hypothetical protein
LKADFSFSSANPLLVFGMVMMNRQTSEGLTEINGENFGFKVFSSIDYQASFFKYGCAYACSLGSAILGQAFG